jgi:pimeloyl-ACP methyl ester carboxylesterase
MRSNAHQQPPSLRPVRAIDGVHLRYRVWPSEILEPRATLVLLNGIMSNSAWFEPIAARLGHLHVVGADRRGSGPNAEARGDAPSARQLVDDVLRIIDAEHAASRPLVLLGWCWGAALGVVVAHALGRRLDGFVAVTPGLFPSSAVDRALEDQADRIAGARLDEAIVRTPIREEMFTVGPELERFIRRDQQRVQWMTPRMVKVSRKLATAAVGRLARLHPPVLLVLATDDEATDNQATLRAFERLSRARLEVVELPAKHGVQFDAPDPLSHHLSAFVARVG